MSKPKATDPAALLADLDTQAQAFLEGHFNSPARAAAAPAQAGGGDAAAHAANAPGFPGTMVTQEGLKAFASAFTRFFAEWLLEHVKPSAIEPAAAPEKSKAKD